jgi:hypothetical protein
MVKVGEADLQEWAKVQGCTIARRGKRYDLICNEWPILKNASRKALVDELIEGSIPRA